MIDLENSASTSSSSMDMSCMNTSKSIIPAKPASSFSDGMLRLSLYYCVFVLSDQVCILNCVVEAEFDPCAVGDLK